MQDSRITKTVAAGMLAIAMMVVPVTVVAQGAGTILKPADLQKLMPASVFYRGQTATTQLRNSGGVKFADGFLILTSLVDTSGYSTGIAANYQAYFITEVPIKVGGHSLSAGAYGVGFIAENKFIVTDLGAHVVLSVGSATDSELKRPVPLEILPDSSGGFRLYAGRSYVILSR